MTFPCQNPSCKSFGKPHPHCKCGESLAQGGEVSFCSENRPHDKECELAHDGKFDKDALQPVDHEHQVSGYLAKHGLFGLLKLSSEHHNPQSHEESCAKGHKHIDNHLKALFANTEITEKDHSKVRKLISDWMDHGGIERDLQYEGVQHLAEGGKVDHKPVHSKIADSHPEQNVMLQMTKGRVSNYLNSLKPQEHSAKLAFDDEPDQRDASKSYHRAIDIANNPLSVLSKIKKGTIEPEHIKHLNAMYPELSQSLQKKVTSKITEAQVKKEKPSYKIRQGLSLLMGTPLSGEMSPQNIQAAQATFVKASSNKEQTEKPPKHPTQLTKSAQAFLTGPQALTRRQQKYT